MSGDGIKKNPFLEMELKKKAEYEARKKWYEERMQQKGNSDGISGIRKLGSRKDSPIPSRKADIPLLSLRPPPVPPLSTAPPEDLPIFAALRPLSPRNQQVASTPTTAPSPLKSSQPTQEVSNTQESTDVDGSDSDYRNRIEARKSKLNEAVGTLKAQVARKKKRNLFLELEKQRKEEEAAKRRWFEERRKNSAGGISSTSTSTSSTTTTSTATNIPTSLADKVVKPANVEIKKKEVLTHKLSQKEDVKPLIPPQQPSQQTTQLPQQRVDGISGDIKAAVKDESKKVDSTPKIQDSQKVESKITESSVQIQENKDSNVPKIVKKDEVQLQVKPANLNVVPEPQIQQKELTYVEKRLIEKKKLEDFAAELQARKKNQPEKPIRFRYFFQGDPPPHPLLETRIELLSSNEVEKVINEANMIYMLQLRKKREEKMANSHDWNTNEVTLDDDDEEDVWWDDSEDYESNELEYEIEEDEQKIRMLEEEIKRLKEQELKQVEEELARVENERKGTK